jgi:DNA-binding NarL/FixJ family response regulator
LSSIKVLLVEDHFLTRIGLKSVLGKTDDIEIVAEADNGQQAVEMVDVCKPDVILMDVSMPIMDGIEAATTIRRSHPDTKIVMLTASDNDSDIFAALAAGAGGYCLKDAEPERLYRAIRSVNDGDIWLDSAIASRVLKFYAAPPQGRGSSTAPSTAAAAGQTSSNAPSLQQSQETPGAEVGADKGKMAELSDPLSPREMEVLQLLVDGMSNQEIGNRLVISLATTKTHVRNILNKLAVDDRTQAAVHAMRRGLV